MPDDLSLGEIGRRLEWIHNDLKDDINAIAGRLDGKVSTEVFKLEQASQDQRVDGIAARVSALEQAKAQESRQRATDRRLVMTALILPIVVGLVLVSVQVLLNVQGVL